jgi:hypothetical protein
MSCHTRIWASTSGRAPIPTTGIRRASATRAPSEAGTDSRTTGTRLRPPVPTRPQEAGPPPHHGPGPGAVPRAGSRSDLAPHRPARSSTCTCPQPWSATSTNWPPRTRADRPHGRATRAPGRLIFHAHPWPGPGGLPLGGTRADVPFASACQAPARPRKTMMARPSRSMSSSASWPMRSPSLARGTVVSLSTISRLGSRNPLTASGVTGSRISGASVGSLVNAHTVTDPVASKRSSWTIATGRGLPVYPLLPAAVQISPLLNRRPGPPRR